MNKIKKILKATFYFILGIVILNLIVDRFYFITTSSHKQDATRTIHSYTVKYIAAETMKCSLGETTAMNGNLICPELNAANVVDAAVKTLTDKNPYSKKINAVRISTSNTEDEDVGYVNLSASGSDVVVKSCNKKPCKEKYKISNTVSIK